MKILTDKYFNDYKSKLKPDIESALHALDQIELTLESFTFYTSVAVMSSSKIEGEEMEIDSYVNHKVQNIEYLPELTEKPNDLFRAYSYARENKLTEDFFFKLTG